MTHPSCMLKGEIHDPHPVTDAPWCEGIPDPGLRPGDGPAFVVMRRMEQLKSTIDLMTIHRVDTQELQRAYDQVHRALTKAFGLPR